MGDVRHGVEVFLRDGFHESELLIDRHEARPRYRRAVEACHHARYADDEQGDEALVVVHVDRSDDEERYAGDKTYGQDYCESGVFLFGFEGEFHRQSSCADTRIVSL